MNARLSRYHKIQRARLDLNTWPISPKIEASPPIPKLSQSFYSCRGNTLTHAYTHDNSEPIDEHMRMGAPALSVVKVCDVGSQGKEAFVVETKKSAPIGWAKAVDRILFLSVAK